jgi:hypothetical protein
VPTSRSTRCGRVRQSRNRSTFPAALRRRPSTLCVSRSDAAQCETGRYLRAPFAAERPSLPSRPSPLCYDRSGLRHRVASHGRGRRPMHGRDQPFPSRCAKTLKWTRCSPWARISRVAGGTRSSHWYGLVNRGPYRSTYHRRICCLGWGEPAVLQWPTAVWKCPAVVGVDPERVRWQAPRRRYASPSCDLAFLPSANQERRIRFHGVRESI